MIALHGICNWWIHIEEGPCLLLPGSTPNVFNTSKVCYFFVYSREASLCQTILFDEVFLAEKVPVAKNFFVYAILPELLGRWYSRTHVAPPKIKENVVDNQNTCTCRNQNIVSDTANCDDKSCVIKTYYLSCHGLEVQPKGKWFCPYCARKKN